MRLTVTVPRIEQRTERWAALEESILSQLLPGDELLTAVDSPPHGDYGSYMRNKFIAEAKGDYILFVDDDDLYLPGALAVVRQRIEETGPGRSLAFNALFEYDGKRVITGGKPIFGQGFRWFPEVYAQSQVVPVQTARNARPWSSHNNGLYSDQYFWNGGGAGQQPAHFDDIIIRCAIARQNKPRDW